MSRASFGLFTSDFLVWMAGIQVRGLLLLALVGIALFCLRRSSAAMRHLALALTVLSLLALPLLSLSLPSGSAIPLPYPVQTLSSSEGTRVAVDAVPNEPRSGTAPAVASGASQSLSPDYQKVAVPSEGAPTPGLSAPSPVFPIIAAAVLLIWGLGTLLLLLRLGISLLRLRRMATHSAPMATIDTERNTAFSALSLSLGLRQAVELRVGTAELPGLSPVTWGFWHAIVLLPMESTAWTLDRLRLVLLHELAHVQRGDFVMELLSRVVCALYWPNPLVWLIARRLQSESECACDDSVLLAGIAPVPYAQNLVEIARGLKQQREQFLVPFAAVRMAHHSQVAGRVRAILSAQSSRRPATTRVVALSLLGVTGLLLPLANLRVAAAGDQDTPADTTPLRIGDTTFYAGALPMARLMVQMKPKMTLEEYRQIAATRIAPGSDRFPNGLVAEGLYVSGMQSDGIAASWDRKGNLLSRGPNWQGSGLKAGELRFQIDRLKLPGMPEWIDKATFDRLTVREIESEFGVVGGPAGYFGRPGPCRNVAEVDGLKRACQQAH